MGALITGCFAALSALLALIIVLRLLTGEIRTAGLFANSAGGPVEPERVQAILIAFALPLFYAASAYTEARVGTVTSLPEVPDWMLVLAAGSQTLYLSGKIARQAAQTSQTTTIKRNFD